MSDESALVYQRDIEEMSFVELAGRLIGAIVLCALAFVTVVIGLFSVITGRISMVESIGYPLWGVFLIVLAHALVLPLKHYAAENGGSGL